MSNKNVAAPATEPGPVFQSGLPIDMKLDQARTALLAPKAGNPPAAFAGTGGPSVGFTPVVVRTGGEILVNTATNGEQWAPQITALSNGWFVVTWQDASASGGDTSQLAVRAQVFTAAGYMVGTEILVNTATSNDQFGPQITALSNGGFVVTWSDRSGTAPDTSGAAVRAQVFSATGATVGTEILVNTATSNDQFGPQITALSNGGFVVTWWDNSRGVGGATGDSSNTAVKAQVFTAAGAMVGTEILVNTATANGQHLPQIITLSNGGFVVTWTDYSASGGDTSGRAVRAQVFTAAGAMVGTEILVNTATNGDQYSAQITALSNGGFVVTWEDWSATAPDTSSLAVRAQVFTAAGTMVGTEILVNTATAGNQSVPQITALSNGGFVVTWTDGSNTGGDTSGGAVRAQVFTAAGAVVGTEILVNTVTNNGQFSPLITALSNGGFVVTWYDMSKTAPDTSGNAIRAQVFTAAGAKVGTEILVNTNTNGDQYSAQITALPNGGFVVTWEDWSATFPDTSPTAVRAQVFNVGPTAVEQAALSLKGTGFTVSDPDAGDVLTVTLSTTYGVLSATAGTSGAAVSGSGTASVTLTGTAAQIAALLNTDGTSTVSFMANTDSPPVSATITLAADDSAGGTASTNMILPIEGGGGPTTPTPGVDILTGTTGNDVIDALEGGDFVDGGDGDDVLIGSAGKDTLVGGEGADSLAGGDGDDRLDGGAGSDLIDGGAGTDTVTYAYSATGVVVDLAAGTGSTSTPPRALRTSDITDPITQFFNPANGHIYQFVATPTTWQDALLTAEAASLAGVSGHLLTIASAGEQSFIEANFPTGLWLIWIAASDADVEGQWMWLSGPETGTPVSYVNWDTGPGGAYPAQPDGGTGENFAAMGGLVASSFYGVDTPFLWVDGPSINAGQGVGFVIEYSGLVSTTTTDTLTNIENVTGSAFDDTITGNESANFLEGGAGSDTINGGAGNDLLVGGSGDGSLAGGAGDDTIDGGAGADTATYASAQSAVTVSLLLTTSQNTGGAGLDRLTGIENLVGSDYADILTGNNQENDLRGGAGDDRLDGGTSNDILRGGLGNDSLIGGAGLDTAAYDDATSAVAVSLAIALAQNTLGAGTDILTGIENLLGSAFGDTLTGDGLANTLTGGDGDDRLYGGAGNDTLIGGAGADILDGQAGIDAMNGGAGNDTYYVDTVGDTVTELAGGGTDRVWTSVNFTLGATTEVEELRLTNAAGGTLTGNALVNKLYGAGGNDTLLGMAGADTLEGGDGNDTLDGGVGNDVLFGGTGVDTLLGGASDDSLDGGTGADVMTGGAGQDSYRVDNAGDQVIEAINGGTDTVLSTLSWVLGANVEKLTLLGAAAINGAGNDLENIISGNAAANIIDGGGGNDTLRGEGGDDTIIGGAGGDSLFGGDGVDLISGDAGNDTVYGGAGDDVALGGADNDRLFGEAGADSLDGGAGADTLDGGADNDTLIGGAGNDKMTGGSGADSFVIGQASVGLSTLAQVKDLDTILDLNFAAGDRIDLSGIDANSITAGDQAFTFVGAFTRVAGQAILAYSASANTTTLALDVDGDGRADYQLIINGNQTGTTGDLSAGVGDGGWVL